MGGRTFLPDIVPVPAFLCSCSCSGFLVCLVLCSHPCSYSLLCPCPHPRSVLILILVHLSLSLIQLVFVTTFLFWLLFALSHPSVLILRRIVPYKIHVI